METLGNLPIEFLLLQFGVEVRLSQFTLTKLVIITPYYLLVNQTEVSCSPLHGQT